MRRVLHDFYIPVCKDLVKNVASAMGPTSRFIIADMIMPDKVEMGTEVTPYWMDFNRKLGPRITRVLTDIGSNDAERNGKVEKAVRRDSRRSWTGDRECLSVCFWVPCEYRVSLEERWLLKYMIISVKDLIGTYQHRLKTSASRILVDMARKHLASSRIPSLAKCRHIPTPSYDPSISMRHLSPLQLNRTNVSLASFNDSIPSRCSLGAMYI